MVDVAVESLRLPRRDLVIQAGFLALIAAILTVDARRNTLAPFDRPLIDAIQRIDLPFLTPIINGVDTLTSSTWAIALWGVALVAMLAVRWWVPALAVLAMPWGGFANNMIGTYVVTRTRPEDDTLLRTLGEVDAPSFPSGHVMGAVMLYGFLLYLLPRMRHYGVRRAFLMTSLAIIPMVGFGRIWVGAHWPSDVLAAYAMGGLVVVLLIMLVEQVEHSLATLAARFSLPDWVSPFSRPR